MEYKTRIEFSEEELEVLIFWIFMDESKPDKEFKQDVRIINKLKSALKRVGREDLIEEFNIGFDKNDKIYNEFGLDITEEIIERKNKIENIEGIFFCPKCKIRTNEKTYETKCVICNSVLNRS